MSEKHSSPPYDQLMNTNKDEPFVQSSMTREQELHTESHAPYLKVFAALAVFTAIEYFYARIFKDAFLVLVLGLLFWAVIKASMVGWYFMHLKFEGNWVYYMLVPAGILAIILTCALIPDVAMQPVTEENIEEESPASASLPVTGEGDGLRVVGFGLFGREKT